MYYKRRIIDKWDVGVVLSYNITERLLLCIDEATQAKLLRLTQAIKKTS